jgi:outer membrane protein OmpA-like peptidoglycan-associated protein
MKTVVAFFLGVILVSPLNAKSFFLLEQKEDFEPFYYMGGGLSYSFLNPEKAGDTAFKVSDDNDFGYRLYGGYKLNNLLSGELIYMDLGDAEVSTVIPGSDLNGSVSYKIFGLHGNYFIGQDYFEGYFPFVKFGLSSIKVSDNVNLLNVDKENSVTLMTGLGVTKSWKNDLNFRFDLDFFSRDAAALSIGLQYDLSKKKEAPPKDSDQDGVFDDSDQCPGTSLGVEVDQLGCEIPIIEEKVEEVIEQALEKLDFKGINFEVNSAKLTESSSSVLKETAEILLQNESVEIRIKAHTDSDGSAKYNLRLSQLRANSVRDYLIQQGVDESLLEAEGFGEQEPIADNSTTEGKAANRRVEFEVVEEEVPEGEAFEEQEPFSSESTSLDDVQPQVDAGETEQLAEDQMPEEGVLEESATSNEEAAQEDSSEEALKNPTE